MVNIWSLNDSNWFRLRHVLSRWRQTSRLNKEKKKQQIKKKEEEGAELEEGIEEEQEE